MSQECVRKHAAYPPFMNAGFLMSASLQPARKRMFRHREQVSDLAG